MDIALSQPQLLSTTLSLSGVECHADREAGTRTSIQYLHFTSNSPMTPAKALDEGGGKTAAGRHFCTCPDCYARSSAQP